MQEFIFSKYYEKPQKPFDKLLEIFLELLVHTAGDVNETLDWMRELDKKYKLTTQDYTLEDFVDELKTKGYLQERTGRGNAPLKPGSKAEQAMRQKALDQVFGKLRKGLSGSHKTKGSGTGEESAGTTRAYAFGDLPEQIAFTESLRNAQMQHGIDSFVLTEQDLEVYDREFQTNCSTVLMIDISHSMILYGEDRITPAKKVAMALAEFIRRRYPKDTLDIVVFGNDAWEISLKDLPYLTVGPFHTNTVAGLQLAMDILRRKKSPNRQIFMITDGKPSCLKTNDGYYKNSFGLDPIIVNKTVNLAAQCRKLRIPITTFMIARDPYLMEFVEQFSEANGGKAIYTGLGNLGEMIMTDFENNRKRRR